MPRNWVDVGADAGVWSGHASMLYADPNSGASSRSHPPTLAFAQFVCATSVDVKSVVFPDTLNLNVTGPVAASPAPYPNHSPFFLRPVAA